MYKLSSIIKQTVIIVAVSAGLGLVVNSLSTQPLPLIYEVIPPELQEEKWETVTVAEVMEHINNGTAIIIDARDPNEYEAGHIPGSLNLPETQFMDVFQELGDSLPREIPLIVYCQGGDCDQSHAVLERLKDFGFELLLLYPEGWNEWKETGYPTEP